MPDTDRHGWNMPTVNGDNDQWGSELNTLFDDDIEEHVWITKSVSSDYTPENYEVVVADASNGDITVTLPSPRDDLHITVLKISDSGNTVTIATPGTETINGQSNNTIDIQYNNREIVSDGSNYFILV